MKSLKILFFLVSCLFGQDNPKIYASLGDKLFDANTKFMQLQCNQPLSNLIDDYKIKSEHVRNQGFHVENSKEAKEYLLSLRTLENNYQQIIGNLKKKLINSMEKSDYKQFSALARSGLIDIFGTPSLKKQVIEFYQLHKHIETINYLEKLSSDIQLESASLVESQDQEQRKTTQGMKQVHRFVDQENIPIGGRGGLEITKNQTVAQSFTIQNSGQLIGMDLVDIRHHRCTPSKSLYVSLIDMNQDSLGPHSYYTRELHSNEITQTIHLNFGSYGPSVKSGEKYAIFLSSDAAPSGCTYAWGGGIETYNGGKTFINKRENIRDMKFRTYVLAE